MRLPAILLDPAGAKPAWQLAGACAARPAPGQPRHPTGLNFGRHGARGLAALLARHAPR